MDLFATLHEASALRRPPRIAVAMRSMAPPRRPPARAEGRRLGLG
eukprot:CAMPEP_0176008708 /NCGR_PEP_ID=MMETSP0120_2-20121206/3880_1 /TAXON_ID=160619 /ORGANISM="Kryptoperidinium foliaceum, Strain CCMP 1326" /LENGTH=44 /DNA_ID= /DNA_START= /DNA_END= /DNA_ORIENTATION=